MAAMVWNDPTLRESNRRRGNIEAQIKENVP